MYKMVISNDLRALQNEKKKSIFFILTMQLFHPSKMSQNWLYQQAKHPLSGDDPLSTTLNFDQSTHGKAHTGAAFKLLDTTVQST